MMKASIEKSGGVAEESKKFQQADLKIKLAELDLRKKQATGRGAKEEIEKERRAAIEKQGTLLQRISSGISGCVRSDRSIPSGKLSIWNNSPVFSS